MPSLRQGRTGAQQVPVLRAGQRGRSAVPVEPQVAIFVDQEPVKSVVQIIQAIALGIESAFAMSLSLKSGFAK